jgi:flagellar hook-length control protein FliK
VDDSSVRGETREIKTAPAESRGESVAPAPSQGGGEAASAGAATSRFSQHLVTRGTKPPAEEGPHVREADQARFLNRVARAFQAAQDRGGEIRLRLSPPELGALKLEVKLQSGVLSAHIEADTPEARALLLDNLPQLRQRLAEQDIRVEQFDVDLADRQPGGAPDDPREGGRQQDESTRSAQRRGDQPAGGEETLAATAARFRAGSNQLNVIV